MIGSKVLPNHCGKGACLPSPPCRRCFPSPLPLLLSCLFITLFLLDVIPLCLSSVSLWKSQHMADLHTSRRRLTEPTMVCTCQTPPPLYFRPCMYELRTGLVCLALHCNAGDIRKWCEGTLERLQIDCIDLYMVHWYVVIDQVSKHIGKLNAVSSTLNESRCLPVCLSASSSFTFFFLLSLLCC